MMWSPAPRARNSHHGQASDRRRRRLVGQYSIGANKHVLLVVDKTLRKAEGGILMEAFNGRWYALFDDAKRDFDESESLDNLLEGVDSLADAATGVGHDGSAGMSSAGTVNLS